MISSLLNALNRRRWCRYLFVTPLPYAIGTACEEIYFAALRAREMNRTLVLLGPRRFTEVLRFRRCNAALFEVSIGRGGKTSGVLRPALTWLLSLEFFVRRALALALARWFDFPESWRFLRVGIDDIYTKGLPSSPIDLSSDVVLTPFQYQTLDVRIPAVDQPSSRARLSALGLEPGRFVCLHVREAGYRRDAGRREYRNASIATYLPAVRRLVASGYQVVRMGDPSMTQFPEKIDGFIDYPFSAARSDEMDLCLVKDCAFLVGMIAGVLDAAWLYHKPVLITNMFTAFQGFPRHALDRGIPQHLRPRGSDQLLTLREWLDAPWSAHSPIQDIVDFEFVNNSAAEIDAAVEDFLVVQARGDRKSALQLDFNRDVKAALISRHLRHPDRGPQSFRALPIVQQLRMTRMTMSIRGAISQPFLEANY